MLLSEVAEAVTAYLNSSPEKWAGDLQVLAKTELDPSKALLPELGVYIIPQFTQYNVGVSKSRSSVQTINNTQYISLIVSQVFLDLPIGDGVANWDEAKAIVDVRERAERFILTFSSATLTISEVDPQPLNEIELDHRNFVALTTFGFEQTSCGTEFELPSSLIASRSGTESERIGASIRSQLSSGRRRDS